jgi:hypothetical protein
MGFDQKDDTGSRHPRRYLATFVLAASALAIGAELVRNQAGNRYVEPATVLTIALVIATVYYAYQTYEMVRAMDAANAAAREQNRLLGQQAELGEKQLGLLTEQFALSKQQVAAGQAATLNIPSATQNLAGGTNLHVSVLASPDGPPAFGVTVCTRGAVGETETDGDCTGWGTLSPGEAHTFIFDATRFFKTLTPLTSWSSRLEVDIHSQGAQGQKLRQTYVLDLGRVLASSPDKWWWERSRTIEPTFGDPIVQEFAG